MTYPTTPDGRYFVVRGRLWRCSNPQLLDEERLRLTAVLMAARRAKGIAMRAGDEQGRELARQQVDAAKIALGERGPVWWSDGAPDGAIPWPHSGQPGLSADFSLARLL